MKSLIENDIIGSINENLSLGNITQYDARKLKRLTHKLYNHIYSHYQELEELNEMTDESLMLDIDIIEKEHEKELATKLAQKASEYEAALYQKDAALAAMSAENAALKAQLAALQDSKNVQ